MKRPNNKEHDIYKSKETVESIAYTCNGILLLCKQLWFAQVPVDQTVVSPGKRQFYYVL